MSSPRPFAGSVCSRLPAVSRAFSLVACCLALACGGCSDSSGHRVSGQVTFNGSPVPAGKIYFSPDASKQNKGQPGYADIKDGSYDTGRKGSQGITPGPTVLRIEGFDAGGKMIFLYATTADLPKETSTKDIDVPAAAANNVPKGPVVQP